MAAFKILLFVACAVALAAAEETERVKKDVVLGAFPYAAVPYTYGYDDGKYYPGKYEKPTFYSAAAYTPYTYGAYPYSYGAYPYAYSYGAYPYSYGSYFGKSIVY